jgi:hypothetical protein
MDEFDSRLGQFLAAIAYCVAVVLALLLVVACAVELVGMLR